MRNSVSTHKLGRFCRNETSLVRPELARTRKGRSMTTTSESRESDIVLALAYLRNRINLKQPLGMLDIRLCEDAAEEVSRLRRIVAKLEMDNLWQKAATQSETPQQPDKATFQPPTQNMRRHSCQSQDYFIRKCRGVLLALAGCAVIWAVVFIVIGGVK